MLNWLSYVSLSPEIGKSFVNYNCYNKFVLRLSWYLKRLKLSATQFNDNLILRAKLTLFS